MGRAQDVLVVGGDFDPVTGDDLKRLLARAPAERKSAAAIFVTELDEPGGYARVVHERGRLVAIVEGTDAPAALRASNWSRRSSWCSVAPTSSARCRPWVARTARASTT